MKEENATTCKQASLKFKAVLTNAQPHQSANKNSDI
jgi:hypothetical protein